jgi:DDE superfamily endonuclease
MYEYLGRLCDVYGCVHRNNLRDVDRIRYYCRLDYRRRILINLGLHPNDGRKEIRFCNHHKINTKKIKVSWYNKHNNQKQIECKMNLPDKTISPSAGSGDNNKKRNKGTGIDRLMLRYISQAQREKENGNVEAATLLAVSQVIEQSELTIETVDEFNETILDSIGLCLPCHKNVLKCDWVGKRSENKVVLEKPMKETKYRIDLISDDEIKEYTGFSSLAAMIAYIVVLCNGKIDEMTTISSDLNWFEEWLLYFERLWGRSCIRWVDCRRKYSISKRSCCRIFDRKLSFNVKARRLFPRFATLEEDVTIRKVKWGETYGNDRRLIMWDNTDVTMYKPSQAEAQRLTYSQYYSGNVGKGSVFIQPCGWMGTGEIWTGGVSDSDYMVRSKILEYQQHYLPIFDPENQEKKWNIIVDKGYRITTAAWQCGEQLIIQPAFAQSDKQFTSLQTLRSAAIAADRSGNERAVKYSKMCGYVGIGLRHSQRSHRMCDVWLCWSFQCNFMFKPVH